jgi:AraC family L-rhamnose operon transcriptional activator RhaR
LSYMLDMSSNFFISTQTVSLPCEAHSHNFLELAYIREGWTQHTVNGKSHKLKKGDFVLLDFDEVHSYDVVSSNLVVTNCLFLPSLIDSSLSHCRKFQMLLDSCMMGIGYTYPQIIKHEKVFQDNDDAILTIIKRIESEFYKQEIGYYSLIRVLLIDLIIQAIRMIEIDIPYKPGVEISWILEEIRRAPSTDHSLTQYAARFQMRPEVLSRLFQKQVGEGFSSYLRRRRMELACQLLLETNIPVSELSERCGYYDGKSFREAFRKTNGLSPREYRKRGKTNLFTQHYLL